MSNYREAELLKRSYNLLLDRYFMLKIFLSLLIHNTLIMLFFFSFGHNCPSEKKQGWKQTSVSKMFEIIIKNIWENERDNNKGNKRKNTVIAILYSFVFYGLTDWLEVNIFLDKMFIDQRDPNTKNLLL